MTHSIRSVTMLSAATLTAGCSKTPTSSSRSFLTLSRLLAAQKATGFAATHKQIPKFGGGRTRERRIRKGGEIRLVSFDHPELANRKATPRLPELDSVRIGPELRHTPLAFTSGKNSVSQIFGIPKSLAKDLSHLDQPFSIVRKATLESFTRMEQARQGPSDRSRFVLTGPAGCGKSTTLLQTVEYCAANGWFVFYVPRAIDWVNSTTAFQYDARTRTFVQSALAQQTLKQLSSFNRNVISSLTLSEDVVLERVTLQSGSPLQLLIDRGLSDPTAAQNVVHILLEQLSKQNTIPVLLAVDEFQALYSQSLYRDPTYHFIDAFNLSMPRTLLEYASGRKSFGNGALVAAVSMSNNEFPITIELKDALGLTPQQSSSTWMKRHPEFQEYAKGLSVVQVPSAFNVHEAAALMEVWDQTATLHSDLNEAVFLAKMAETGGNPRELLRRGYLTSLVTF